MSNPAVEELVTLLTNENTTLVQLRKVLDKESDALLHNDINAVEGSAVEKKSLLARFEKQVLKRLDYLSAQGFESSEQGFDAYLHSLSLSTDHELPSLWSQLKSDFHAVIKQNEQNGIVIHHSQNRTRELLNILHGNKNQPNLYNDKGTDKGNRHRRSLGEA